MRRELQGHEELFSSIHLEILQGKFSRLILDKTKLPHAFEGPEQPFLRFPGACSEDIQISLCAVNWQSIFNSKTSTFFRISTPFGTLSIFRMGYEVSECIRVEKVLQ